MFIPIAPEDLRFCNHLHQQHFDQVFTHNFFHRAIQTGYLTEIPWHGAMAPEYPALRGAYYEKQPGTGSSPASHFVKDTHVKRGIASGQAPNAVPAGGSAPESNQSTGTYGA